MRKIFLLMLALFVVTFAYATTADTKVSGSTVKFGSTEWSPIGIHLDPVSPTVVTFSSVTRHIRITNLSRFTDCYADLKCRDANGKRGHAVTDTCVVLIPALGNISPNSVEFDFSTHNLGFVGSTGSDLKEDQRVHYVVTGDQGDF